MADTTVRCPMCGVAERRASHNHHRSDRFKPYGERLFACIPCGVLAVETKVDISQQDEDDKEFDDSDVDCFYNDEEGGA